ncbi:MAG TPA: GNAT family N-acetyltransferase [Candidatus Saccharimonadales bacterium]|nr:GNAT family N-acetyltransferase [Candidatus Saccharimonadales bacterium]
MQREKVNIIIRDYKPSDYAQVAANLKDADMLHLPWDSEENLNRKHERDPHLILVATVDDKIVGSLFIMEDGWSAFMYRLAVEKYHRGKGVGSAIIEAAEKLVKQRGVNEIHLWVDQTDKILVNFYKKRDYSSSVTRLLMTKKLK